MFHTSRFLPFHTFRNNFAVFQGTPVRMVCHVPLLRIFAAGRPHWNVYSAVSVDTLWVMIAAALPPQQAVAFSSLPFQLSIDSTGLPRFSSSGVCRLFRALLTEMMAPSEARTRACAAAAVGPCSLNKRGQTASCLRAPSPPRRDDD